MRILAWLLVGVVIVAPMLAEAAEGVLVPFEGTTTVFVWKSAGALKDGYGLIQASAPEKLIRPLLACTPAPGERVTATPYSDGVAVYERVIVISGPSSGCRGVIHPENFKKTTD